MYASLVLFLRTLSKFTGQVCYGRFILNDLFFICKPKFKLEKYMLKNLSEFVQVLECQLKFLA